MNKTTMAKARVYTGFGVIDASDLVSFTQGVEFRRDVLNEGGTVIEENVFEFWPWHSIHYIREVESE